MNIYKLRRTDFKIHIILTAISTIIGLFSVFQINKYFGSIKFADYALSMINIQIIINLSDLGIRYSFFKPQSSYSLFDGFKYLIILRACIALVLFFISLLFYHTSIYLSHVLILLGLILFPNLLFQKYKLYTLISANNFIYRSLPLLLLFYLKNIESFVLIAGLILLITAYTANKFLGVFSKRPFNYFDFRSTSINLIKGNTFLSLLSVINIFEVYIHIFLGKFFLSKAVFADFIYVERYANYVKQGVVYLYDFFYPKITLANSKLYQKYARLLAGTLVVFILCFLFLNDFFNLSFIGNDNYLLFIGMVSVPVFILLLNFVQSVIYFKYCSDKRGFAIVASAIITKVITIIFAIPFLGVLSLPLGFLFAEMYMGFTRTFTASQQLNVKIQLI